MAGVELEVKDGTKVPVAPSTPIIIDRLISLTTYINITNRFGLLNMLDRQRSPLKIGHT